MNPADASPWLVSSDPARIDAEAVHRLLRGTYWAESRPLELVKASLEHSIGFGAYLRADGRQIGFARVVTDHATFSWICDVVVEEGFRGRGVGKALMAAVMDHPSVRSTTNLLGTRDAHGLYERHGFVRREMMRRSSRTFG